jgi:rhodanese-related sulfurtransferase
LISVPRLEAKGLQAIDSAQAMRFYHDARRENDRLVFVDARSEENYQRGHIPGAHQLDPYHPEKHLLEAMTMGKAAEVIVVYCNGGDCEDSELSALLLRNVGIPNQKLFIYTGGIADWTSNRFPIETGARKTGKAGDTKP